MCSQVRGTVSTTGISLPNNNNLSTFNATTHRHYRQTADSQVPEQSILHGFQSSCPATSSTHSRDLRGAEALGWVFVRAEMDEWEN